MTRQAITPEVRTAIKHLMGEITLNEIFEYDDHDNLLRHTNGDLRLTPMGKWLIKLERLLDNWDLTREVQELYKDKV